MPISIQYRKPLRAFSDREDAKLLMLVEQQYIQGGEEPTDLVVMRNKLAAKDRFEDGTLTKKEVISYFYFLMDLFNILSFISNFDVKKRTKNKNKKTLTF